MTTPKPIAVTHNEVTITYIESTNKWRFELRGRERSADSLTAAKEAIDKPAPKKAKPFERINEWYVSYNAIEPCIVTSISENDYGDPCVWIASGKPSRRNRGKAERSKVSAFSIVPASVENDKIINAILAVKAEINALDNKQSELTESLPRLKITEEPQ